MLGISNKKASGSRQVIDRTSRKWSARKIGIVFGVAVLVLAVSWLGYTFSQDDADSGDNTSSNGSNQDGLTLPNDTSFAGFADASLLENAAIDDGVDDAGRFRYYLGIAQDYLEEGDHESATRVVVKAKEYNETNAADQLELAFVEMRIARVSNDGSFSDKANTVASQLEQQYVADKNANYSRALQAAGLYAEAGSSDKALELYNEVLSFDDSVFGAGELSPEEIKADIQRSIDAIQ